MHVQAEDSRAGSAERDLAWLVRSAGRLRDGTMAMGWAEIRKLRHDHLDIFTRSVQPLLWLFIFGTALRRNRALSGGFHDYRAYLAPGVMAQAALFLAIFFGLAVIWERDVGQLQRLLATPLPRLGQMVMMPLFFASSALYPLAVMPGWLRVLAHGNPLTYEVLGMRQLLLGIGGGRLWLDFLVPALFLVAAAVTAAVTYPRAVV